ncbi:MAG: hypothetical protein K6G12_06125 [Lachnospiraceae bacterium]|nr:hypothetical protein [Lachnospiraceae bacterium]
MDFKEKNVNQEQQQIQQPIEQQQVQQVQQPLEQQQLNQAAQQARMQQAAQEEGQVQAPAEDVIQANEPEALVQAPLEQENVEVGEVRKARMSIPSHDYSYMIKLDNRLLASKHGKKDGKEMKKIKELHTEIIGYMDLEVDQDHEDNNFYALMLTMNELCSWCDKYVSNHNPWSDSGKERLRLVKELRAKTNLQRDALAAVREKALKMYEGATFGDLLDAMSRGVERQYEKRVGNESQIEAGKYDDALSDVKLQAQKELNARKLILVENENKDKAIKLRNMTSMEYKKKTNYLAVCALSEFMNEDQAEFEKLLKTYGNYNKEETEAKNKLYVDARKNAEEKVSIATQECGRKNHEIETAMLQLLNESASLKGDLTKLEKDIADLGKKKEEELSADEKKNYTKLQKDYEDLKKQVEDKQEEIKGKKKEIDDNNKALTKTKDSIWVDLNKSVLEQRKTEIAKREEASRQKRIEALNMIKGQIYGLDLKDISLSSDDRLVACSEKLENISRKVKAFRTLMKANPEYMASLPVDEAMKLTGKMDALESVSNYYRIRKLLISEPEYVKRLKDFSIEDAPGDDFEIVRIKKLMRASYYLGENMKNLTGIAPTAGPVPEAKTPAEELFKATLLNSSKLDFKKSDLYKLDENNKPVLDNYREYLANIHDQSCSQVEAIINQCEQEKLFVPEEEDKIKLIPNKKYNEQGGMVTVESAWDKALYEISVTNEQSKRYQDIEKFKEKEIEGEIHQMGPAKFGYSVYDGLDKMSISDNLDRMLLAYSSALSYRKTSEEMKEILRGVSIYRNQELEKYKYDPEALEYYESMYIENAMKQFALQYAASQRIANGVGEKFFFMHPLDILPQISSSLKTKFLLLSIVTNVNMPNNISRVKAFSEKFNADKRYLFDFDDYTKTAVAYGSVISWEVNAITSISHPIMRKTDADESIDAIKRKLRDLEEYEPEQNEEAQDAEQEAQKANRRAEWEAERKDLKHQIKMMKESAKILFGDSSFYKYILSEVRNHVEANPDTQMAQLIRNNFNKHNFVVTYFSMLHPEYFSADILNAKDKDGNHLLTPYLRKGRGVLNSGFKEEIDQVLNDANHPWRKNFDKETKDKYTESLKKRDYAPLVDNPDDPYDYNREYDDTLGREWEVVQQNKRMAEEQGAEG